MKATIDRFNRQLRRISSKGVGIMSGPERFEKFTKRARKVLTLAQEEAQSFNHNYVGTEHLLLGLVREGEGVAARVLVNLGVDADKVRKTVAYIISRGEQSVTGEVGLTPRSKKAIELAVVEARQLNHQYIGTEHLLLGLLREDEGVAAGILKLLGVTLEKARTEVLQILKQSSQVFIPNTNSNYLKINSTTPYLDSMGVDVTEQVRQGRLDPIVERAAEMERLLQILSRRTKANALIVGKKGVGKTTLVEDLARRIVVENVPTPLLNRRVAVSSLGLLIDKAAFNAQNPEKLSDYLERLEKIIAEVQREHIILHIDDISLVAQMFVEGHSTLATTLKQAIAHGQIQVIVDTTPNVYQKYLQPDGVFGQYFQVLNVSEPSVVETIAMLRACKGRYEKFHRLMISDEAVQAAAELAESFSSEKFRPDSAFDLMDEAAALVRTQSSLPSSTQDTIEEIANLNRKIQEIQGSLAKSPIKNRGELFRKFIALKQELVRIGQDHLKQSQLSERIVTRADVLAVLSQDRSDVAE